MVYQVETSASVNEILMRYSDLCYDELISKPSILF